MKKRFDIRQRICHIIINLVWSISILILGGLVIYLHFIKWIPFVNTTVTFLSIINLMWAYTGCFIGSFLVLYAIKTNALIRFMVGYYLAKICKKKYGFLNWESVLFFIILDTGLGLPSHRLLTFQNANVAHLLFQMLLNFLLFLYFVL